MKFHEVNKLKNFISGYYIDNNEFLNTLHDLSKQEEGSYIGRTSNGIEEYVKKSLDHTLDMYPELYKQYCEYLQNFINFYTSEYKYSICSGMQILEGILLQYYKSNWGFYKFHSERSSASNINICKRHLVFITYLNDVAIDGETEFFYQNFKVKPKKGLTIIFPADWTFTHRGVPSIEEKSIVTGWIHLV